MSNANAFARLTHLEAKIDARLFGVYRDPNTGLYKNEDGSTAGTIAKTAVGGAAVAGAGYGTYRGVRAVQDRMSGMNISDPGFKMQSRGARIGGAVGSLASDAKQGFLTHPVVAPAAERVSAGIATLKKKAGAWGRQARGIEEKGGQMLLKLAQARHKIQAASPAQYARELAADIDAALHELESDDSERRRHVQAAAGGLAGVGLAGAGYYYRDPLKRGAVTAGRSVMRGGEAVHGAAVRAGRAVKSDVMYHGTRGYRAVENVAVGAGRRVAGAYGTTASRLRGAGRALRGV